MKQILSITVQLDLDLQKPCKIEKVFQETGDASAPRLRGPLARPPFFENFLQNATVNIVYRCPRKGELALPIC